MNSTNTQKLVYTALFTALSCIATMFISIPSPIGGYIHPGDAAVLLGAYVLGPIWGAVAAGLGSALADIFLGYTIYAPATLIIKAATAFIGGCVLRKLMSKNVFAASVFAGIAGETVVVLGYLFYSAVVLGFGAAALVEIPGNIVQGLFGATVSALLLSALRKTPVFNGLLD